MLTYNGIAALAPTGQYANIQASFKDTSGHAQAVVSINNYRSSLLFSNPKMVLGDGTTAPTKGDYAIENEVTGLTLVSLTLPNNQSASYNFGELIGVFIAIGVFSNETNDDITINEIAYYTQNSSLVGEIMLAREVLDSPVTVHPGHTKSFTMTIK